MLQSAFSASTKKNYISTAVASFVGIMAAVPISLAMFGPGNQAGAVQDQSGVSTAEVSGVGADYAQFAYAYSQGYLAQASTSTASAVSGDTDVCSEAVVTPASVDLPAGGPALRPAGGSGMVMPPEELTDGAARSYHNYQSFVYNSASTEINNTNSNNNVGSNNAITTNVKVSEAKGVTVNTDNTLTANNLAIDDSLNKDSYNTKTDTTIVNDSFKEETSVVKDSGNATATTVDNSTSNSETTNVDITDSGNTTTDNSIKGNELDVEVELETQPAILPNQEA